MDHLKELRERALEATARFFVPPGRRHRSATDRS
jgi:hypothetical protein